MGRSLSAATRWGWSSCRPVEPIDYRDRVRRLSAALSAAGLDAYVGTRQASLHYLAGAFIPWRGAVVVTASGDAELLYWVMDAERVRQEGWGIPVIDWAGTAFMETLAQRLAEKGLSSERIGLDLQIPGSAQMAPGLLLAQEFLDLKQLLPGASLCNGTQCIDEQMLIKEPAEIERLRMAARAADSGFAAGLAAVRPGVTENHVAGAIEMATRERGSTWAWSVTGGTEVGSGPRTAFFRGVTQQATDRKIGLNEFVILDLHPLVELYMADLGVPIFVGSPDREQQRMIDCWEETVNFLLSALGPGRRVAEVCRQAADVFDKHGLAEYGLPMFGHGLGTCARLRPFMGVKSKDVLRPGMVLALGTHLYRPPYGGLRLEYPVLITETAAEPLCETLASVYYAPA